jgi:hypothetical protein
MRRTPIFCAAFLLFTGTAYAQEPLPAAPTPQPQTNPETQKPSPNPAPSPAPNPAQPTTGAKSGLRLHVITTRSTYLEMPYDVFNTATRQVVATGTGVDESVGKSPQVWDLDPGIYKIVQHGQPFDTKTDFATAVVAGGQVTDFVIVVEPDTFQFRGSGVVSGELPHQHKLLGFRIAATVGGSLMLNERENVVGATSGFTTVAALFGNFSLVYDRGNHFLSINSEQSLGLTGTPTSSLVRNTDRWEGSLLYAYNINNPYVGPYARQWFKTSVAPGYLYLQSDLPEIEVDIYHCKLNANCGPDARVFGTKANPDDLRVRVSDPFSPFILQEEIGGNLKAVNLDLLLVKLAVATRIGFGFRQGFISNLLVVDETGESPASGRLSMHQVDDYSTLGPVIGANATVTFARWLYGSSGFQMLIPLKDTGTELDNTVMAPYPELGFGSKLLIDFTGTAGLRLPLFTDFLFGSFDWTFRLERDAFITARTQFDQTLMARVNLSLF